MAHNARKGSTTFRNMPTKKAENFQRTKKMKLTVAVDGMELASKAIKEIN